MESSILPILLSFGLPSLFATYWGSVTSYSPDDLHAAGMCLS